MYLFDYRLFEIKQKLVKIKLKLRKLFKNDQNTKKNLDLNLKYLSLITIHFILCIFSSHLF